MRPADRRRRTPQRTHGHDDPGRSWLYHNTGVRTELGLRATSWLTNNPPSVHPASAMDPPRTRSRSRSGFYHFGVSANGGAASGNGSGSGGSAAGGAALLAAAAGAGGGGPLSYSQQQGGNPGWAPHHGGRSYPESQQQPPPQGGYLQGPGVGPQGAYLQVPGVGPPQRHPAHGAHRHPGAGE
ncbi:unnamed protein product [Merluccius merluccius]